MAVLCIARPASAGESVPQEVIEATLDDLLEIDVTSVTKRHQKLSDVASAVTVLSGEDIRRAGHTSLAESLRMVPGFHVGHIDANKWSVSSRGFGGRFANKLLVMIDGRSVYTSLFAGVFWDVQATFMPDLDRIEVIRGPGATLWGANAVNGVVNVLTKSAEDTVGTLAYMGGGVVESGFFGIRHGGTIGEDVFYRAYFEGFRRDDFKLAAGADAPDGWHQVRGGIRVDADGFTADVGVYSGEGGESVLLPQLTPPFATLRNGENDVGGGHVRALWHGEDWEVQAYYDFTEREETIIGEQRHTVAIDFEQQFVGGAHTVIWGAGYRATKDHVRNTFWVAMTPTRRTLQLFSAFIQDEIVLIEEQLVLTVGTKLEHNDFTGLEIQPSIRALWKPDQTHVIWASASRAVRTPSRADRAVRFNSAAFDAGMGPTLAAFFGSPSFDSEDLVSFEIGYRVRPDVDVLLDLTAFYNIFDNLRMFAMGAPGFETTPAPPHGLVPSVMTNNGQGDVYGLEFSGRWNAGSHVRFDASYSLLLASLEGGIDGTSYPRHQLQIRATLDLSDDFELDVSLYYVGGLRTLAVNSYVRTDIHVGWRPSDTVQLDLGAQNLLESRHPEFLDELPFTQNTEVPTSVYLRLTIRF